MLIKFRGPRDRTERGSGRRARTGRTGRKGNQGAGNRISAIASSLQRRKRDASTIQYNLVSLFPKYVASLTFLLSVHATLKWTRRVSDCVTTSIFFLDPSTRPSYPLTDTGTLKPSLYLQLHSDFSPSDAPEKKMTSMLTLF